MLPGQVEGSSDGTDTVEMLVSLVLGLAELLDSLEFSSTSIPATIPLDPGFGDWGDCLRKQAPPKFPGAAGPQTQASHDGSPLSSQAAAHWSKSPEKKLMVSNAPPPDPVVSESQYTVYSLPLVLVKTDSSSQDTGLEVGITEDVELESVNESKSVSELVEEL